MIYTKIRAGQIRRMFHKKTSFGSFCHSGKISVLQFYLFESWHFSVFKTIKIQIPLWRHQITHPVINLQFNEIKFKSDSSKIVGTRDTRTERLRDVYFSTHPKTDLWNKCPESIPVFGSDVGQDILIEELQDQWNAVGKHQMLWYIFKLN